MAGTFGKGGFEGEGGGLLEGNIFREDGRGEGMRMEKEEEERRGLEGWKEGGDGL